MVYLNLQTCDAIECYDEYFMVIYPNETYVVASTFMDYFSEEDQVTVPLIERVKFLRVPTWKVKKIPNKREDHHKKEE